MACHYISAYVVCTLIRQRLLVECQTSTTPVSLTWPGVPVAIFLSFQGHYPFNINMQVLLVCCKFTVIQNDMLLTMKSIESIVCLVVRTDFALWWHLSLVSLGKRLNPAPLCLLPLFFPHPSQGKSKECTRFILKEFMIYDTFPAPAHHLPPLHPTRSTYQQKMLNANPLERKQISAHWSPSWNQTPPLESAPASPWSQALLLLLWHSAIHLAPSPR